MNFNSRTRMKTAIGHSTVLLTLDTYSHVLPTMQARASAKLEELLYTSKAVQKATGGGDK